MYSIKKLVESGKLAVKGIVSSVDYKIYEVVDAEDGGYKYEWTINPYVKNENEIEFHKSGSTFIADTIESIHSHMMTFEKNHPNVVKIEPNPDF